MATSSRARRRTPRAALDAELLDAAARADLDAVRTAIARGADVNASDEATGHTVISCAIAGDRCGRFSGRAGTWVLKGDVRVSISSWEDVDVSDASFMLQSRVEVLRTLISSDTTSLYALNAPVHGVTPLGLAAWLNIPDAIRVLLDESRGLVAVDGTDALGVTPLMYTARDGAAEAASLLLAKGARPDLRDTHHRTAIQHALRHPQLLCLCESALRKQRAREYLNGNRRRLCNVPAPYAAQVESWTTSSLKPKPSLLPSEAVLSKATAGLVRAICAGDVAALYQHLFHNSYRTSVLVNRLDYQGWSPLHHCVCSDNPSIEILDALFLAGADTSLYTASKHGTPLHCLARQGKVPVGDVAVSQLHAFVKHLVLDLRAPLSAKDANGETCIHVAAEHGHSIEVLRALLACDPRGVVRSLKNSRGLTALQVARPELRIAFGADSEPRRSSSVASFRTVRPFSSSLSSTSSYGSLLQVPAPVRLSPQLDSLFRPDTPSDALPDEETSLLPHRILDNLALVGHDYAASDAHEMDGMRDLLDETVHLGELWIRSMQTRIKEGAQELRDARGRFGRVDTLLEDVTRELEDVFGTRFSDHRDSTERARRRTTDSGESDATAVSGRASSQFSRKWRSMSDLRASKENGVGDHPDMSEYPYPHTKTIAEEDEPPSSPEKSSFLNALLSPSTKELAHKSSKGEMSAPPTRTSSPFLPGKKDSSSGTARLKAWFRKKLKFDLADGACEVKAPCSQHDLALLSKCNPQSPSRRRHVDERLLSISRNIIQTANRDLSSIEGCMDNADHYLTLSSHMLLQTERRLKSIVLNRKAALESARIAQLQDHLDDPFMSAIASTVRAASKDAAAVPFPLTHARNGSDSDYSLGSKSAGSSMISLSSTLIESEDDDTRVLRRFLTRKVEARLEGAFEEIDKVMTWLRIVQDALRNLRRRTHASMTSLEPYF
ncbi:ankyrin [Trametes cingulata]|nr:ankyrin [Trametes cingulata]